MEKRGRQRRKARWPVRFGTEKPEKMGLITDVSARGIYIATNAILPPGSAVRVEVSVPGAEALQLDGRVMRARRVPPAFLMTSKGGMGVRLLSTPAAWRALHAPHDER